MQAIILAAGMGKRLKELTQDNTKCMVKVNGVTLIERMLRQLERQHLSRIVIVVGYRGQKLIDFIATLDLQTPIVQQSDLRQDEQYLLTVPGAVFSVQGRYSFAGV